MTVAASLDIGSLNFDKGSGLVTVVAIDSCDGAVLMVAHADREALERTEASGEMHYLSRSRGPWHKGATSGAVQHVVALVADCDADAVLAIVKPAGPACHTGAPTCFEGEAALPGIMARLDALVETRARDASVGSSYVKALLSDRNLRLKKLGEEATELAVAAADDDREAVVQEAADVLFHVLVAVRAAGGTLREVLDVLAARERGG